MHEFTIASSIHEALIDLAKQQGSTRVLEVHLKVGKLRALSIDQMKFSYDVLSKGTILEGSRLTVEESSGSVKCPACDYNGEFSPDDDLSFHFGIPPLICPKCGKSLTIEGGDECIITRVRMLAPSDSQESAVASDVN
jgi:hydrogenase nickel incorporation protein HypA/HybF